MGHKGSFLRPRCIGPGGNRTQIPSIHMSASDQYEGTHNNLLHNLTWNTKLSYFVIHIVEKNTFPNLCPF
jgi:hypothetical protein